MKNYKLIGIIALVAVIGFSFIACDDGSTHTHSWGVWRSNATQHWKECDCGEEYGRANHTFNGGICSVCYYNAGGPASPTGNANSAIYTSYDSEGNSYQLQITKGANNSGNGDNPGNGDPYTLTIKSANGSTIGTSTGYVANVSVNGATYTITLNHNSSSNTVSVTVTGNGIDYFSGDIRLDSGGTHLKPGTLTGTKPGTSNPGNGNVSITSVANTSGQLTINGLGKYNGEWAYAVAIPVLNDDYDDDLILFAAASATPSAVTLAKISGGSVTLKVWKQTKVNDNSIKLDSYSGNHKDLGVVVVITNKSTITDAEADQVTSNGTIAYFPDWLIGGGMSFSGVDFSNGRASCTPGMLFDTQDLPNYPGSGYNPGTGGGGGSGSGTGWPSSAVLSDCGISGLSQPAGSNFEWESVSYGSMAMLAIDFTTTNGSSTSSSLRNYFSSNGWTTSMDMSSAGSTIIYWTKSPWTAIYSYDSEDNAAGLIVTNYGY